MKSLYLLRHAKYDRRPGVESDPPLDDTGRRDAERVGEYMGQHGLKPGLILCSAARRASETQALVAARLECEPEVSIEQGITKADEKDLLSRLQEVGEGVATVLLIGHNPALHRLASTLAGSGDPEALARLSADLPSGSLTAFSLPDKPWLELGPGDGTLTHFVAPTDLG
jgi:phosphohistidine phosphatase